MLIATKSIKKSILMRIKHNDHDHDKFCFAHLALWWSPNDASVCWISAIKQHTMQFDSQVGAVNS